MDWTLEDHMDDGLFYATLTGRRGGHTPSVQVGAEISDGAEAVKKTVDFPRNNCKQCYVTKK